MIPTQYRTAASPLRHLVGGLLLLATAGASAQYCGTFTDVPADSPFCEGTQWIRNRSVTFGCGAGLYCPAEKVRRDAMALFMNRLALALTPEILYVQNPTGAIALPGPSPAAAILPCVTEDTKLQVFGEYARQVVVTGVLAVRADGTDAAWRVTSQVSTDGGNSWSSIGGTPSVEIRRTAPADLWAASSVTGHMELAPGTNYRFALAVRRDDETTTAGNIVQGMCQLAAVVSNRNPATPPF